MKRYLGKRAGKVMLLNGLRRTGKTVMAQQAIAELPDAVHAKTAFIKISQKRTVPNLPVFALVEDLFYEASRAAAYNGATEHRAVLWISADELLGCVGHDP